MAQRSAHLLYSSYRLTFFSETVAKTHLSFDVDEESQLIRCVWSFSVNFSGFPWPDAIFGSNWSCTLRLFSSFGGFYSHWQLCCCSHWIFSFKLPFSARAAGRGSTVELAAAVACAGVAGMLFCDVSCTNGLCGPACPVTPPSLMTFAVAALAASPSHIIALNGKRVAHHTFTR